eukprot:TRINITY_DN9329_c0_g1_i12.p1 TRINITY_DN9329_c0_g1~~TRINITY_DN9329_c0_g1_i12.p1  ORF type:complete len:139 (+),score=24.24 TRINITY_DN9329_c0_g1_i12:280-696(+)
MNSLDPKTFIVQNVVKLLPRSISVSTVPNQMQSPRVAIAGLLSLIHPAISTLLHHEHPRLPKSLNIFSATELNKDRLETFWRTLHLDVEVRQIEQTPKSIIVGPVNTSKHCQWVPAERLHSAIELWMGAAFPTRGGHI